MKKSYDQKGLQFKVQFDGKPNEAITYQVIVFDRDKKPVFQEPVRSNSFVLPFSAQELSGKRIFLAPYSTERKIQATLDNLESGSGFEVNLSGELNPNVAIEVTKIPEYIWQYWWFCSCHMRGRVFNWCGNEYLPVFKARVHICEVDPIIWYIKALTDYEVFKLRDDILGKAIDWHLPDPPPDTLQSMIKDPKVLSTAPVKGMSKIAGNSKPGLNPSVAGLNLKPNVSLILPTKNITSFYSDSAYLVKDYLVANYKILYPYWCWLYPFFWKCDEVAVVETNEAGWFESDIWYYCFGDKPDLYFWVEYYINGVWTTVYNPGLGCGTHWDYACNSEVDIYLNDQRIPCPVPQPNIGDKDVFVFSIGNNVSVTKVYQDGVKKGQTMTGTPYEDGSPFGGSIEPRVYFGKYLCDAIDGGNNYFYKWSFRKEGEVSWNEIGTETRRHYLKMLADGPSFPTYPIGTNADKLYRILRYHLPLADGGNDLWVVDSRTDTASTKLISTDLNADNLTDDFGATDGVYEIKMELYKYVGAVATRVNWTAEGIKLFVPLNTLSSPFGDVTVDHETDNNIIDKYKYMEGLNLFGFTMKIFIDNKPSAISLEDVNVLNADGTTGVQGPCGFLAFKNRHTSMVNFQFNASQQNNFATFGFSIIKGNGTTDVFTAGDRVGVPSTPLNHNGVASGILVNLVGSDYEVHVTPDFLLGACDKAAFLQGVNIHPLVQDGYSRLYNDSSLSNAFALEHHAG